MEHYSNIALLKFIAKIIGEERLHHLQLKFPNKWAGITKGAEYFPRYGPLRIGAFFGMCNFESRNFCQLRKAVSPNLYTLEC